MLSRVADSLYWMSRYLERAEHTTRLLDVNLNLMLDEPTGVERRWKRMIAALGHPRGVKWTGDYIDLVRTLTFDMDVGSSITSCIVSARENARHVREQISTEQWQRLNRLYLQITDANFSSLASNDEQRAEFLSSVMEAVHQFQGVTDSTMSHGEGWQFIQIGRYMERATATSRCWRSTTTISGATPTASPRATSIWSGWGCCARARPSRPTARSTPPT